MIIDGVVIADVHIGAVPPKILKEELWNIYIKKIHSMKKLDIIVISGDLIDHRLSFNSEDSKLAIEFVQTILKIAKKKKAKVRILKGTRNHDLNQLNNFNYLQTNPNYDFKIINTVTVEQFADYKVLYIPEEYMEDKDKYYKEYFEGQEYDLCFGHGTFSHVGFVNQSQESERPIKNAPLFSYEDFKNIMKGPVFFGHIHTHSIYKNLIHYVGSFSRWCFGEEEDKGFSIFKYDTETNKYKVGFIKNTLARVYKTLDVNKLFNDDSKTIEQKIKIIEMNKQKKNIDYLRIKFDKITLEQESDINLFKEYFSNVSNDNVKIAVSNIKRSKEEVEKEKIEDEYSFIFKKEFSMPKIISLYLEKHDNIIINEEDVNDVLHNRDIKEE